MLKLIAKGQKPKRPWKTMSDGDLWEHFFLAASSKGINSIKLTWVKGHATDQHITDNITNVKKGLAMMKRTSLQTLAPISMEMVPLELLRSFTGDIATIFAS